MTLPPDLAKAFADLYEAIDQIKKAYQPQAPVYPPLIQGNDCCVILNPLHSNCIPIQGKPPC